MSLNIAIQMDDISSINIESDTTYILALEAQNRDYNLFYYQPSNLSMLDGEIICTAQNIKLSQDKNNYYQLGTEEKLNFADIDIVLMRQDPPFDMNYLTYTYFLERIMEQCLVINNPIEVRNCPEKIFACAFPDLMPPTLISSDRKEIAKFMEQHNEIVIKPLYAFGGDDVFKISPDNFDEIIDLFKQKYNHPFIAQKYLSEIKQGDKRIILIDGKPYGAINRLPGEGSIRSNFAQGGMAEETVLSKRDIEICDKIGGELKKRGLILAGIDVIGNYLTEINVTSPTGIRAINEYSDTNLEVIFWDIIEEKLK